MAYLWFNSPMRDNDGRKLDHATLEAIRVRACEQIEDGARAEDVAASLGFNRSTVFGWVAAYREGGAEALRANPVPGRPPKLTRAQTRMPFTMIAGSNPARYQLDFALWTRDLVRQVIATRFGVELSVSSVGRILRGVGMSPQRPLHRATRQDPERVARRRAEQYPAIRDEAARVGATVYLADETALRSDYHSGTTWAPIGQTPIVVTTGTRHSINMIYAVTAKGAIRFTTFTGEMNADVFITYCCELLHDDGGIVFLVIDGHPVHRSRAVKDSPPQPKAGFACSFSHPTHRIPIPMNESGRTSNMTVSARPPSRPSTTCATKLNPRSRAPNAYPSLFAHSSGPMPQLHQVTRLVGLATFDRLSNRRSRLGRCCCGCRRSPKHRVSVTVVDSSTGGSCPVNSSTARRTTRRCSCLSRVIHQRIRRCSSVS